MNYEKRIDELKEKIIENKLNKEQNDLAINYAAIGTILAMEKKYDKALEFFNESQTVRLKNDDKVGMIKNYLSMAKIYQLLGDNEKALSFVFLGINIISQIKEETGFYHPLTSNLNYLKEELESV